MHCLPKCPQCSTHFFSTVHPIQSSSSILSSPIHHTCQRHLTYWETFDQASVCMMPRVFRCNPACDGSDGNPKSANLKKAHCMLQSLITFRIFVRCQRLINRNVRQLFSSNRGVSHLYEACRIDDVSRGSLLGYEISSFAR
jgi:hypothetical protein